MMLADHQSYFFTHPLSSTEQEGEMTPFSLLIILSLNLCLPFLQFFSVLKETNTTTIFISFHQNSKSSSSQARHYSTKNFFFFHVISAVGFTNIIPFFPFLISLWHVQFKWASECEPLFPLSMSGRLSMKSADDFVLCYMTPVLL